MFSTIKTVAMNDIVSIKIIILKILILNDVFSFLLNFGGITDNHPKIIKIAMTKNNKIGMTHSTITRLPSVIL